MTEGAGDSDPRDVAVFAESGPDTDHGVLSEQLACSACGERIVKDELQEIQLLEVHFQSEPKGLERLNLAIDDFVKPRSVGPELLVAEGVVPEDLSSLSFEIRLYL